MRLGGFFGGSFGGSFLGGWLFSGSFGGRFCGGFCCRFAGFDSWLGVSLGEFSQSSFAAANGISFQETFFDGFVVFRLSLGKVGRGRISFESFDSGLDGFLDFLIVLSALDSLASGFFCGFDNRHENSLLLDNI